MIELYSAFAKKIRVGEITEEDFRATIKTLAADLQRGTLQLVVFGHEEKKEATELIERYGPSKGLRTLDAMQLAVMRRLGMEVITCVYCADRQFVAVLEQEGFSVIDPERA